MTNSTQNVAQLIAEHVADMASMANRRGEEPRSGVVTEVLAGKFPLELFCGELPTNCLLDFGGYENCDATTRLSVDLHPDGHPIRLRCDLGFRARCTDVHLTIKNMTEHLDGRVLITEGQGCWCRLDKPTVRYERGEVLVGDVQAIGTAVYFRDQKDKGVWIYAGNAYT